MYTRVDAETRYKTKNFIDTSVWRFGDVVVTSGFNGLRALGAGIGLTALVTVLAALASARVGWTAAHLLERARAQPRE